MLKKLPKILVFLCTMSLIFGVAGISTATPMSYEFQMGDDSYIDTSGTADPGLVMWTTVYSSVHNMVFPLNEGESKTFLFARIGTHEDWINDDDLVPSDITAYIDFDVPDITGEIPGTTVGFAGSFHFFQGWSLVWEDVDPIEFGIGGLFSLELTDASYRSGLWLGPDGLCGNAYANVYATVTLEKAPSPIPEPATMLLLGSGLIGLATFGRKKFFKK
jgi:hypothetical protein